MTGAWVTYGRIAMLAVAVAVVASWAAVAAAAMVFLIAASGVVTAAPSAMVL